MIYEITLIGIGSVALIGGIRWLGRKPEPRGDSDCIGVAPGSWQPLPAEGALRIFLDDLHDHRVASNPLYARMVAAVEAERKPDLCGLNAEQRSARTAKGNHTRAVNRRAAIEAKKAATSAKLRQELRDSLGMAA